MPLLPHPHSHLSTVILCLIMGPLILLIKALRPVSERKQQTPALVHALI